MKSASSWRNSFSLCLSVFLSHAQAAFMHPSNLCQVRPTPVIIRLQFGAENRNYRLRQSVVIFLWCLLFLCQGRNDPSLIVIRGIRDNKAHNYLKGFHVLCLSGRAGGGSPQVQTAAVKSWQIEMGAPGSFWPSHV